MKVLTIFSMIILLVTCITLTCKAGNEVIIGQMSLERWNKATPEEKAQMISAAGWSFKERHPSCQRVTITVYANAYLAVITAECTETKL